MELKEIKRHVGMLGLKVEDRVTGYKGVVEHVGFDLYGCVQAIVRGRADERNEIKEGRWFDVNRLAVLDTHPVTRVPDFFEDSPKARGEQGPAEKTPPPEAPLP